MDKIKIVTMKEQTKINNDVACAISKVELIEKPKLTLQELQFLKTLVTDKQKNYIVPSSMKEELLSIRKKLIEVINDTSI